MRPTRLHTLVLTAHAAWIVRAIILIFMLAPTSLSAQLTAGVDDTINPGVPVTLTATYGMTAVGIPSIQGQEDWVQGPFQIGFDFSYFGNKYTVFWVGANGWISFSPNTNAAGIREPIAIPSAADYSPKNCIMGPFQDLYPVVDGSPYIFYQTIGQSPKRKLVVMWCDCPLYLCTSARVTFQIVLEEENYCIENHIYHKPACNENYGNKATLGIQNSDGFKGFSVPGHNASSWTADTAAWRYKPTSADSFQIIPVQYHMQPITPGDKISYVWYEGSKYITDQQSLVVAPSVTTTYKVYCTLCSGETFTDEVTVHVIPYIPNAFTPNGDGVNDEFKILGLPPENITRYNLQIFNRWGQLVFSTNNIREAWDGKRNGEYCPTGDYAWIVFYEDDKKNKTGNKGIVALVR